MNKSKLVKYMNNAHTHVKPLFSRPTFGNIIRPATRLSGVIGEIQLNQSFKQVYLSRDYTKHNKRNIIQ